MSKIDQSIILRLTYIKSTYEHALRVLINPIPLDAGVALILMDNSLEASFKLVLDNMGSDVKRDPKFPELLDLVTKDKKLGELNECRLSLLKLHTARNAFQHQGIIPDMGTVLKEYKPLTEKILSLVSKQEFGLEWADISLCLLIRDEMTRKLYGEAEKSFERRDYVSACAYLIYTFESIKADARNRIFGSGIVVNRLSMMGRQAKDPVAGYLTTLDEEIETFKLGLNYLDLRNYLDLTRMIGIDSILYQIPYNARKETMISDLEQKLKTLPKLSLLGEWFTRMRDPILRFVIQTEAIWRFSLKLFSPEEP